MKLWGSLCACLLFLGLASSPAVAQSKPLKAIPAEVAEGKALLIIGGVFKQKEGFIKSASYYTTLHVVRYDVQAQDWVGYGRARETVLQKDETRSVAFNGKPFAKAKQLHGYSIYEVTPGDYTIGSTDGTSFSLGSIWFSLKAGDVAYLGETSLGLDRPSKFEGKPVGEVVLRCAIIPCLSENIASKLVVTRDIEAARKFLAEQPALANRLVAVPLHGDAKFGNHINGLLNKVDIDPALLTDPPQKASEPVSQPPPREVGVGENVRSDAESASRN